MTLMRCGAAAVSCWLALYGQAHAELRMLCPGGAIGLDTLAASKPFVRMRLGPHEGNFLIDTGATSSQVDAGLYGAAPGATITLIGSSLPTLEGGSFNAADRSRETPFAPPGGVAGSIGTDILSSRTVEFHYENPSPYLVLSTQRCSPRVFEDAGFVSVAQPGFGAPTPWLSWLLSPFAARTDIVRRANVPVIYARIGSVSVPFWMDTGWGLGATRHMSFPVNAAILNRLRGAGIAMQRTGTLINSDCQNNRDEDAVWKIADEPIVFTTEDGSVLFEYGPPELQIRGRSSCGTIGNWSEPIGTLGAQFLPRLGTVVFDGPNRRVWIPKAGTVVPARDAFRGMAFARNEHGRWSLSIRDTLESARGESLKLCNEGRADCRIDVTIDSSRFACLAVAKKPNIGMPAPAASASVAAARSAALTACTSANGMGCVLVYSGCND